MCCGVGSVEERKTESELVEKESENVSCGVESCRCERVLEWISFLRHLWFV